MRTVGVLPRETAVRSLTAGVLVVAAAVLLEAGVVAVAVPVVAFELLALAWPGLYGRERAGAAFVAAAVLGWFFVEYGTAGLPGLAAVVPAAAVEVGYRWASGRGARGESQVVGDQEADPGRADDSVVADDPGAASPSSSAESASTDTDRSVASTTGGEDAAEPVTLEVSVTDAVAGEAPGEPVRVRARRPDAEHVVNGQGTFELSLPPGTWDLSASLGAHERTRTVTVDRGTEVSFELGPTELVVDLGSDATSGRRVACSTADGTVYEASTGDEGRAVVPLPAGTRSVTLTVDDWGRAVDVRLPDAERVTLPVARDRGRVVVETVVDDEPTPEIPVVLTPDVAGGATAASIPATSGDDGSATVSVPAGEYEVALSDEAPAWLTCEPESVFIDTDREPEVVLDIGSTFGLDDDHRLRLTALHGAVDSPAGFDLAAYYRDVVAAVAATVERLPDEPGRLAAAGVSPQEVVDELLTASENWGERLDDVIAECDVPAVTPPDDEPDPEDAVSVERLLEHLARSPAERTEYVDDRTAELADRLRFGPLPEPTGLLAVVEELSETNDGTPAGQFVVLALVDATDRILDRSSLVERLARDGE